MKLESLVWVGPPDLSVTDHFLSLFKSELLLDGDVYAGLDFADSIASLRSEMGKRRGIEDASAVPSVQLFTKDAQARMVKTIERHEMSKRLGLSKATIIDTSQSEYRNRENNLLPAATKSASFYSISRDHIFSQAEIDFAMGWPVFEIGTASQRVGYSKVLPAAMQKLSGAAQRRLSGNGMCLQQVLSWFLYVQAHCLRKDAILKWAPPLLNACYNEAAPAVPARAEQESDDS